MRTTICVSIAWLHGLERLERSCYTNMSMLRILRHILLVLVAVAFVGGTAAESARAVSHGPVMLMNGMPCDMQMPAASTDHSKPVMPCKGMTHDCINMAGCMTIGALPVQFATQSGPAFQRARAIWPNLFDRASLNHQPEPLPPRAA